jgi:RsiW-degrading membrane proteinase PrsW (M82 family)
MNYKKHMTTFMVIAVLGLLLLLFAPTYGAAILLPAIGAFFGARKAQTQGPKQPRPALWGIFFVFVATAVAIRSIVPEENFGGFDQWPESLGLFAFYSATLAVAYLMFGYLAYLQRVGRSSN